MAMYALKHAPRRLSELSFNKQLNQHLYNIAERPGELNHMLFYGLPSSGKITRVRALLCEIFGDGVYKLRSVIFSDNKDTYPYFQSNYHIEIDISMYGVKDRMVIKNFIKALTHTKNIITGFYRIIVIKNAQCISHIGQKILLNIIEKSVNTARFIFIANRLSNLISPLRSRFFLLRNKLPTMDEMVTILQKIAKAENISLTRKRALQIIDRSRLKQGMPNLKWGIHIMQYSYLGSRYKAYHLPQKELINSLISIIEARNYENLRDTIYQIVINNVDITTVIIHILRYFVSIHSSDTSQLLELSAQYEANMVKGNKPLLHLEAYIYAVIQLLDEHCKMDIEE